MNQNPFDIPNERADRPADAPLDPKAISRDFSRVGLSLAVLLVMTVLGQVVIDTLATAMGWSFTHEWWYSMALSFVSIYGFGLLPTYLVLRTLPKAPHNEMFVTRQPDDTYATARKTDLRFGWVVLLALVAIGYMNLGAQIGEGVMGYVSDLWGYDYSNGLDALTRATPLWGTLLYVVILAPIAEEFLFRKLLIDRLRRYGDTVAILISAFFFALFHGNLYQCFYAFLVGLLLGYLYTRTGRIGRSMLLHMFINFVGSILPLTLQSLVDMEALQSTDLQVVIQSVADHSVGFVLMMLYSFFLMGAMIASVVLTVVMHRRLQLGEGSVPLPRGARFGTAMGNAGMMTAFILYLVVIALSLVPV